jgi:uncharacterized protein
MSDNLAEDLSAESRKWLERADALFCRLEGEEGFLENISSYLSDSRYFLEKGDLIRAFESVVWAWAWMEIGLKIGLLREDEAGRRTEKKAD